MLSVLQFFPPKTSMNLYSFPRKSQPPKNFILRLLIILITRSDQ
jgi:hypothetical protein